ncbi:MAG: DMT family transporter [Clostridiales bacterium]|nr:DMT family transporter [Clostridiales bacterium]
MRKKAIFFAILAAALYALSSPLSKMLMNTIPPSFMAGLLYLGAGIGMLCVLPFRGGEETSERFTKKDIPYLIGMVILDIIAPVSLMFALTGSPAANISLINNFEIVTTSIIALVLFKEKISAKLWSGITLITIASILLSFEGSESLTFSRYSLFALIACLAWGFENNCTRTLSSKDPAKIVVVKGIGSGTGAVIVALLTGESLSLSPHIIYALLLGFAAYGLSVFFYIRAQRYLGAAKTSAYYAVSPFIGALLSLIIYKELPTLLLIIAFLIMAVGAVVVTKEQNDSLT